MDATAAKYHQSDQRERTEAWAPDVLGPDFEQRRLAVPGSVPGVGEHATLVRDVGSLRDHDGQPRPVAVLYLHGFSDYFFQRHLAAALNAAGVAFYALDLRGFGRSLAEHLAAGGDANMVPDVALHAADLDAAVGAIRAAAHREVVVLAHSMGGLVASRWAAARHHAALETGEPGPVAGLILNSPWFELNENALLRGPITKVVQALAPLGPRIVVGGLQPFYARALHASHGGEWDFDLEWKPIGGFPVRAQWFASIRRAQQQLHQGIDVGVPTLVLSSDRTGSNVTDHPELLSTDSVLSIEQIKAGSRCIGPDTQYQTITGGAHDLALSREPARTEYLQTVVDWLRNHFDLPSPSEE